MTTLYEKLDVPEDATGKEIKKAYHKLSKECHPDAGGTEEEFHDINLAYTILMNQERRDRYDKDGTIEEPGDPMASVGAKFLDIIQELINKGVDVVHEDIIKKVKGILQAGMRQLDDARKSNEKILEKYKELSRRFKGKDEMFQNLLGPNIKSIENNLNKIEAEKVMIGKMVEILKDYKYKFEKTTEVRMGSQTIRYGGDGVEISRTGGFGSFA